MNTYLSAMATKTKRTTRSSSAKGKAGVKPLATKKATRNTKTTGLVKPYDAKKYAGSVPAFASVDAEEMKSWRDDC